MLSGKNWKVEGFEKERKKERKNQEERENERKRERGVDEVYE